MKRTCCPGFVSCGRPWCCAVGLLWSLSMLGCEEPPVPTHRVSTAELPVVAVETAKGVSPDEFQLIQLRDGHDYWFYSNQESSGYAALTHAPDCAKCSGHRELTPAATPHEVGESSEAALESEAE